MVNEKFLADSVFDPNNYNDLRKAITDGTVTERSTVAREALNQNAFIADTSAQDASDVLRAVISNSSTDKLTVIYRIEWYNGGSDDYFGQIIRNPTTNVPTTEQNYVNLYSSATDPEPVPETKFYFESGAVSLSGGDTTGAEITFSQGDKRQDFLYFLEPGESVGVNVDTGGDLTSATVKFTLFFYEIDI